MMGSANTAGGPSSVFGNLLFNPQISQIAQITKLILGLSQECQQTDSGQSA